jgi:serine/threonine protein kinase
MADGRSSPPPPSDGGAAAPEEKKKMIGRYELGELLGEGTFSKVKKAVDSTNGNVVAIKIVNNALVQVRPRAPSFVGASGITFVYCKPIFGRRM